MLGIYTESTRMYIMYWQYISGEKHGNQCSKFTVFTPVPHQATEQPTHKNQCYYPATIQKTVREVGFPTL